MQVFCNAKEMRDFSRKSRREGKKIALVPTMGYLHAGHISLVQAARELAEIVIVSIYVNPTQFSTNEDFGVYPSKLKEDHKLLQELNVAAIFQPASLYHAGSRSVDSASARVVGASELRPGDHETFVQTELLQQPLCGESRPHFFRGVATVVTKLFNIVDPDIAIFGSKDYQQLQVIKRLVRDLDFDIEIVGMPILRESDGLAMSSRNALLSEQQRAAAPEIYQALLWAKQAVTEKIGLDAQSIILRVSQLVSRSGGTVDYVKIVDADTLQDLDLIVDPQKAVMAVAVYFGTVRLIDNMQFGQNASA